jgi:hypothetical protein
MNTKLPSIVGGAFAGFILGFLGWALFVPEPRLARDAHEHLHHALVAGAVSAVILAVIGGTQNRSLTPRVFVPAIVFALIGGVPCLPGKVGLVPLATVYVHGPKVWPNFLLAHLGILLAHLVVTGLVSWLVFVVSRYTRSQPGVNQSPPGT